MTSSSHIAVCATLVAICFSGGSVLAQRAGSIASIAPSAARPGDTVTITGNGFGALKVRVTVGGIPAVVLAATGNRVTFRVPAGARQGATTVTATNPGGQSGSIAFQIIEGVLLGGGPTSPAAQALTDLPPIPADQEDIVQGVILTRLAARLKFDATVGQVNQALNRMGGGIVTMSPDTPSITIAIPRQNTLADVQGLARTLKTQPGILFAWPAIEAQPKDLPGFDAAALPQERFLLASRFPAAWNASNLIFRANDDGSFSCKAPKLPVLIADWFAEEPAGFRTAVPSFSPPGPALLGLSGEEARHGYLVTMAATSRLGANPFVECLDVRLVQTSGLYPDQDTRAIKANMPPPHTKFIVNYSKAFADDCGGSSVGIPCQPPSDRMPGAVDRANETLTWKEVTRARWPDFLMVAAAGNEKNDESAAIYPGMSDATVGSMMAIAGRQDPLMTFVLDDSRWQPTPLGPGFFSLAATPAEAADVVADVRRRNLDSTDAVETNVLLVGSTTNVSEASVLTNRVAPELLSESEFSDRFPDVLAIGEDIFGEPKLRGTSFSAPLVTGLASYMWLLSPELRAQPPSVTAFVIKDTARPGGSIDAYDAILALDDGHADAPVRRAILDVSGANNVPDGVFDEFDLNAFLENLFSVDPDGTISHRPPNRTTADFSIYDLNGDGFTTSGSRRERFDLNGFGELGVGATFFTNVTQDIEGQTIRFNERELTDIEILCYYAYSTLYQGTPGIRKSLLEGRCGASIQPGTASLRSGQQLQFTAQMPGNPPVTWTATGGTITNTGLYTAGTTSGTFSVHATSAADPSTSASATVNISPAGGVGIPGRWVGEVTELRSFGFVSHDITVDVSGTASAISGPFVIAPIGAEPSLTGTLTATMDGTRVLTFSMTLDAGQCPEDAPFVPLDTVSSKSGSFIAGTNLNRFSTDQSPNVPFDDRLRGTFLCRPTLDGPFLYNLQPIEIVFQGPF